MNCLCDQFIFPPPLLIPAGLPALPRQIATFPEFREAMLARINSESALSAWRARSSDDFGIMLLEMWAYVCDSISFYGEAIADESYLRTASLRPSVRKLVGLLGYIPRPAVSARVDLAILAEGRLPITLPAGIQFRSGAFPGGPPQIFELAADSRVHPFLNKWTLERRRGTRLTLPPFHASQLTLLLDPASTRLKAGQIVLVEDTLNENRTCVRLVQDVTDTTGSEGAKYKTVQFNAPVPIPGYTPISDALLLSPSQVATISQVPLAGNPSGLFATNPGIVIFDAPHRDIQAGDKIVLDKAGDMRWFKVAKSFDFQSSLPSPGPITITNGGTTSTVNVPAPQVTVTVLLLDAGINDPSRRDFGSADWTGYDASAVKVHFGFRTSGVPIAEFSLKLSPTDPLVVSAPVDIPQDGKSPGTFLLEDHDTIGAEISASLDFETRVMTASPPLAQSLAAPVVAYGNVVSATRGESVVAEVLGSGDASVSSQTFKLKKSPLTYLPGMDAPSSSLKVYVDGLRWAESPSFFGVAPDAQVYIVRQNDAGDSIVIFGDGIRGSRLTTGINNVVAYYRFGAGKASPPAGSITQMGKPVKGIFSVRNPVAAYGGDDAEPASGLQTYAPRSALLLGRAISLPDMEAAAAEVQGVRAVRCDWQWNVKQQRPLVEVWYIGDAPLVQDITKKLRGLSDSVTPIAVEQAHALLSVLSLSIEIDPRRLEDDVIMEVRASLMDPGAGLLAPEQVGIGLALFQSRIFDAVLGVPGTIAVQGLLLNGTAFTDYGMDPGQGNFFNFENGGLVLNGKGA